MAFGARDGIEAALVNLNFMPLRVGGLKWVGDGRRRNADIDARVLFAAADPPFERQDEVAELLLHVPVEPVPAGGLEHGAVMDHGRWASNLVAVIAPAAWR